MKRALALVPIVALATCGPSRADYEAAIERHWPAGQRKLLAAAAAFGVDAARYAQSADPSADFAWQPGTGNGLSEEARQMASGARFEQHMAAYIATSEFLAARNISCAKAAPLPGENCEATLIFRGQDGRTREFITGWRFNELDGQIEVVGKLTGL